MQPGVTGEYFGCSGELFSDDETTKIDPRAKVPPDSGGTSNGASPPVSRILSWTAIYLGPTLLSASCGLPET